jgi:hypothetical protein
VTSKGWAGLTIAMARKETFSVGQAKASVYGGQRDLIGVHSRPDPEEGRRLMRAFLNIREAALREAVIALVTELSTRHDDEK